MKIKETTLCNNWGDIEAVSVKLDDVMQYIVSLYEDLDISVHYDDFDDYGCSHYITIRGQKADIVIKKNYGGMYCPGDYLECLIEPHSYRDDKSRIFSEYKLIEKVRSTSIHRKYSENIKKYMEDHIKYICVGDDLFELFEFSMDNPPTIPSDTDDFPDNL